MRYTHFLFSMKTNLFYFPTLFCYYQSKDYHTHILSLHCSNTNYISIWVFICSKNKNESKHILCKDHILFCTLHLYFSVFHFHYCFMPTLFNHYYVIAAPVTKRKTSKIFLKPTQYEEWCTFVNYLTIKYPLSSLILLTFLFLFHFIIPRISLHFCTNVCSILYINAHIK